MITKKDYKIIAEAIHIYNRDSENKNLEKLIRIFSRLLKKDNPRFNDIKFLKAIYK